MPGHLIINADDFGYNSGVNRGIIEAFAAGALRSTTVMAAGEAFAEAAELAAEQPGLAVGVHLCLVGTQSVCAPADVPSLVAPDGRLLPGLGAFVRRWIRGKIRPADVARETAAQIDRVREAGLEPSHLDAHKHVFILPGVFRIVSRVCADRGIRAVRNPFDADPCRPGQAPPGQRRRWWQQWLSGRLMHVARPAWRRHLRPAGIRTPGRFYGLAYTGLWSEAYLRTLVTGLPPGYHELMTHPGVMDATLARSATRLKESRVRELELLRDVLPRLLAGAGIQPADFRDLPAGH